MNQTRDKYKKEDLFVPYYQSKKLKKTEKSARTPEIKEGSLQDLLQLSISNFLITLIIIGGLIVVFLIFFFMFKGNIVIGIVFSGLSGFGFQMYLGMKKKEKENKFVVQLPDTLAAVANSLKAGFSLDQAFEFVSMSMPEPTKSEFSKIHLNYRVGLTLRESLEELMNKYPNTEVKLFVSSLVLQAQVGGNVIPFLEELKEILKARVKLRRSIAVGTAQTKLSTGIVALLPYVMLMLLVSSGYDSLTNTLKGILLLVFAMIMQVIGIYLNLQLTQVEM